MKECRIVVYVSVHHTDLNHNITPRILSYPTDNIDCYVFNRRLLGQAVTSSGGILMSADQTVELSQLRENI